MTVPRGIFALLVPQLCAACGRSCGAGEIICARCAGRLAITPPLTGAGVSGLDRSWSSAPHEGVARQLVTALKFRRLLPVAGLMADRIYRLAPTPLLSGAIVPVPTARLRSLGRGFDPAREIASALAERAGLPLSPCLARRGAGRQRGRRRGRRLGDPPRVSVRGSAPRSVVLVDDVLTTGATLAACARALRGAGAARVVGVTYARRL
jgi:predicted amidophosphoribosyltransferase